VQLTDPILSRFDLLTVIKDNADVEVDDQLATFVLNSHMRSHPRVRNREREAETQEEADLILEQMHLNLIEPHKKLVQIDAKDQID